MAASATDDELGREAVRRAKGTIPLAPLPMDVQRDIQAWNDLVQLQRNGLKQASGALVGARPRRLRCFRVMATDWDVVDGKIVAHGVNLDTGPRWLVVFDEDSGAWFHLQGFRQALEEFNRLVLLLRVTVASEDDAVALSNLYRTMVKPFGYSNLVVLSEVGLLEAGLYWTRGDGPQDRARFIDRWWLKNPDRGRNLSMTRERVAEGNYRIEWYVLNPELTLDQESIIIHRDGTISALP